MTPDGQQTSGSASSVSAEIELRIESRRREVDGFSVRRLLPSRRRQTVGPFTFFNHMGPHSLGPGKGVDVPPHPHINLATVTYLFEGELVHRDSLGACQTISPGDINWMHAGSAIVHSERTSPEEREIECRIEGIQLWVALPQAQEETPPRFGHYSKASLPLWEQPGIVARVLVGTAFGCQSPVKTSSNTLYVDAALKRGALLTVPETEQRCIYVVRGNVSCRGEQFDESQMLVCRPESEMIITANCTSRLLILGGDAIDGERHIWWNFVSSSEARIENAKRNWKEARFPLVGGDETERTPLPGH
jgi:redox-sensitive bicupin YhaK (pirin superfamily)